MKLFQKLIYGLNVLAVVCLIFAYVSPYINPSLTWFFAFFGMGYPIILGVNVLFVLYWLIAKPQWALMSFLLISVGYKPLLRTIGFNKSKEVDKGFNVMSYNIGGTHHHFSAKNKTKRIKDFKSLINQTRPDVVCLQERKEWLIPIFDDIFKDYNTFTDPNLKTCIYSKLPIKDHGNITFGKEYHSATWVDVQFIDKIYRIYGLHLSSNKVPNMTDNINEILDESIFVLDEYSLHAGKRVDQLNTILDHAKTSPHPVLITGDFNDMPQSYVYRIINKNYNDAFVEHGCGVGKTQMTRMLGLRIDYAFANDKIEMTNHRILNSDLSDHSPIITRIK